jgi:hypothetical protein
MAIAVTPPDDLPTVPPKARVDSRLMKEKNSCSRSLISSLLIYGKHSLGSRISASSSI